MLLLPKYNAVPFVDTGDCDSSPDSARVPALHAVRPSPETDRDTAASRELARLALRLAGASAVLSVFERVELREKPPLPVLARLITS